MKYLLPLCALTLTLGCSGGDGPDWAESVDDNGNPGADGNTGAEPPRTSSPPSTSPPTSSPPSATPDRDPPVSNPPVETPPSRTPAAGDLALEDVWGEGLDIEVDGLRWAGEGEIQFRVGLVDSATRETVPLVDARNFTFAEDGVLLGAEAWFEVERAKDLRVVMVLDTSYSIREAGALESLRSAARKLVETLPREAQVAVVSFSTEYTLLADFTDDPRDVFAAIERMQPEEGRLGRFTNLWGAVKFAAEHMGAQANDDGGRAIVVFTDGRDNVAEAELSSAMEALAKSSSATYAVSLGADVDLAGLERMSDGRSTSASNPGALEDAFEDVAARIGEKLTVTYMTPKQSGEHILDVTIADGDDAAGLSVRFNLK